MINGMSQQWMAERAATQMTLGKMIDRLAAMQPDAMIDGLENPHSYRGYYSDLAFERRAEKITVKDALTMCRAAMGEVFEGYKGGDFQMGRNTPLWVASYGDCGDKIMAIRDDGTLEQAADE
jgi:hypothetical protein